MSVWLSDWEVAASAVLWAGVTVLLCGSGALFLRRRRGMARKLIAAGALFIALGGFLPATDHQTAARETQLDQWAPRWQFRERHSTFVRAPKDRVFAAIEAVQAEEILLFRTLIWLRRFGQSGPEGILNPPAERPLLTVATSTTFLALARIPERELLVGTIVIAPEPIRVKPSTEEFRALTKDGYALALMNFTIQDAEGGTRLTTETRVHAEGAAASKSFSRYWRIILPGSALIRVMWLRAIRLRAEAPS